MSENGKSNDGGRTINYNETKSLPTFNINIPLPNLPPPKSEPALAVNSSNGTNGSAAIPPVK